MEKEVKKIVTACDICGEEICKDNKIFINKNKTTLVVHELCLFNFLEKHSEEIKAEKHEWKSKKPANWDFKMPPPSVCIKCGETRNGLFDDTKGVFCNSLNNKKENNNEMD